MERGSHDDMCAHKHAYGVRTLYCRVLLLFKVLMRVEAGLLVCAALLSSRPRAIPSFTSPRFSHSTLPLRLLVPLSLALVCFGSSSAVHVVRVLRLLSVRDACNTGGGALVCAYARTHARTHVADNVNSR